MARSTRSNPVLPQASLPARKRQRATSAPAATNTAPAATSTFTTSIPVASTFALAAPVVAAASSSTTASSFTSITTVRSSTAADANLVTTSVNTPNIGVFDLESPSPPPRLDKGIGRALAGPEHISPPSSPKSALVPDTGTSSGAALNPDVDFRNTGVAELDKSRDPLFPLRAQRSATPASQRSVTPAAAGAPTVPDQITIVLHYRIGSPLQQTRPRKNLPGPSSILYSWGDDSYGVLCSKIIRKVDDITHIANVEWKRGSHPYLQPHNTATANKYLSLDNSNCNGCLRKAWIKEFRRTRNQDAICNVYVYLQEKQVVPTEAARPTVAAAPPGQQFQRATQNHILTQSAISQQQPDLQHLGLIGTALPVRATARQAPSNAPITVPSTNTFRETRNPDQQAASLRQHQEQAAEVEQQVWKTVSVRVAGLVLQIEISVTEFRESIGLPK